MAERQAAIQVFFHRRWFRSQSRKIAYDLVKNQRSESIVSGVIRETESESEQSEHFHFFRLHLRLGRLRSAYNLVETRSSEWEAEAEG